MSRLEGPDVSVREVVEDILAPGTWSEAGIDDLVATIERIRPYTMVGIASLVHLALQTRAILDYRIPGDFVECGVWRGGASFLMAGILEDERVEDRKVWLFDSFEGLPPPEEVDGEEAARWAANEANPYYRDNLRVSLEQVKRTAVELGLTGKTEFVKGWFQDTLPAYRERLGRIAILRIDCDWYAGVRECLDRLYDRVVDGGFVVLDDYYTWEGCARAVHEFLAERQEIHRLESITRGGDGVPLNQTALFRKGSGTWRGLLEWDARRRRTRRTLSEVIETESPVVLVGPELLNVGVVPRERTIPFLERDGEYRGAPEDDETAIAELKRLREAGAAHLVIPWTSFWWRERYERFFDYLRHTHDLVTEDDHVMVFELREVP